MLTDMIMPGLAGADVIRALREVNPEIRIIAMSGFLDMGMIEKSVSLDRLELLPKPIPTEALLAVVHRLLTMS